MHRYNNQDHSMLAADAAVSSIVSAGAGKADIWLINTEEDYHEGTGEEFRPTTRTGLRSDGMPLLAIVGPKLTFFVNL